jgi:serine/threonine-protein kinase
VGRTLGQGAYGAVYEATGPFDQRYALKLLVPANRPYAEVQAEWVREAERLLRLRHPGVVYMHDAFESSFLFYMALEWCSSSLREWLKGPLEPETAIEVTRQVLAAVQYLHESDIVHGDLHPGNVLVLGSPNATTPDGSVGFRVKLADFGISQELHGRGRARPDVVHHAIMPPEVVVDGSTSRQSDIYQIGLLLYWMVTGTPALDYTMPYPELVKQVSDGVPRSRAEALKSPVGAVLAKMLRRREAYRYASAREVWDDLRRFWTLRPT